MANDHPLGTPTGQAPDDDGLTDFGAGSIVDTILNLDQLLSADVRRATKTARFYTRADLEGDIDDLEAQLEAVTDDQGQPINGVRPADDELGGTSHPSIGLARRITELRREYAASRVGIRVQQMPGDDWSGFCETHRRALSAIEADGTAHSSEITAMWDDLIARCLIPTTTIAKVAELRAKFGHPQVDEIASSAWAVNTRSGVSVPKSPRSSVVLRRARPAKS